MSKVLFAVNTATINSYDLVVINPVKGEKGSVVFSYHISAPTVTDAVKRVRQMVDGSGLLVLQRAAYEGSSKFLDKSFKFEDVARLA